VGEAAWSVDGKVVVVTGANCGIGLEAARALALKGAHVVMTARDRARGEVAVEDVKRSTASGRVELLLLDLASLASVREAAATLATKHAKIDVLVNNAGLVLTERRETKDGFEMTFGVNHLGPFLFTNLLLPNVKAAAPARIVNVASDAHRRGGALDLDDLMTARRGYSGMRAYCRSKLANILFTRELARRLEGTRVTANALHPGVVKTGFAQDGDTGGLVRLLWWLGGLFMLSPAQGARTTVHLAASPEVEGVTGRYFARCRESTPTRDAQDDAAARRLWDESARLTGLAAG